MTYSKIVKYLTDNGLPLHKAQYVRKLIREMVNIRPTYDVVAVNHNQPDFNLLPSLAESDKHPKENPGCFVRVIVFDKNTDKVLVLHNKARRRWELPGGKVDPTDDGSVETARRELREETGIDVPYAAPLWWYIGFAKFETETGWWAGSYYAVELESPSPTLLESNKFYEFRWVTPNELDELPQLPVSTSVQVRRFYSRRDQAKGAVVQHSGKTIQDWVESTFGLLFPWQRQVIGDFLRMAYSQPTTSAARYTYLRNLCGTLTGDATGPLHEWITWRLPSIISPARRDDLARLLHYANTPNLDDATFWSFVKVLGERNITVAVDRGWPLMRKPSSDKESFVTGKLPRFGLIPQAFGTESVDTRWEVDAEDMVCAPAIGLKPTKIKALMEYVFAAIRQGKNKPIPEAFAVGGYLNEKDLL